MKTAIVALVVALSTLFSGMTKSVAAEPDGFMFVKSKDKRSGWLGVSIQDMTSRLARSMSVKTDEGALVTDVVEDSPAEKAGIKDEDIIVEYNGKKIADADDLYDAVRESKPGATVNVLISRNDEKKTLQTTVGKVPKQDFTVAVPPTPPHSVVWEQSEILGLELRSLNEQLGAYFGAPDNRGVLIEEVEEESKAEKAGFKAGDVITKVGKKTVEDVDDIRRALHAYDEGEKVDVEILRKGSKQILSVEAEDMEDSRIRRFRFDRRPHGFRFNDMDIDGLDDLDIHLDGLENLIELDGIQPKLGKLKIELNRMKDKIKRNIQREIHREIDRSAQKNSIGT